VREDQSRDAHDQKQTQLVTGKKRDKETRHQEQHESTD
jgi:hypothetical protein